MDIKKGFTLSEVLVTVGIIGVVAALTMPTLVNNHQRKVYVTQLHKVYTELSQAAIRAASDNNAISLDETRFNSNNANGTINFLNTYFNVVQDCSDDLSKCFATDYKTLSGDDFTLEEPTAAVVLSSGAAISVMNNYLYYDEDGDHGRLEMQVDTNGKQGPNILGRDLFYMDLYSDGKVAETYNSPSDDIIQEKFESCQTGDSYNGYGCLTKIIHDGWTMDY